MTLADLLRAGALGAYSGTGGQLVDTGVNLANLARAGYGVAGQSLGLLSPSQLPEPIDPSSVPGSSGSIKGLLGVGDSLPEQVAQFVGGLLTPGGTGKAATKLEATVYHGTPHVVDKFDISKVGTGEGAQAYGHGLYFADNPDVARSYQRNLAAQKATRDAFPGDIMAAQLLQGGVSEEKALAALQRAQPLLSRPDAQSYLEAGKDIIQRQKGHLYTVDIPDDAISKMLHWDLPFSQQPDSVKQAISQLIPSMAPVWAKSITPKTTGQSLYIAAGSALNTPEHASSMLNAAGVPGIRYLDGGSRGVGAGTYNTVLFDDALAKILKSE